MTTRKMTKKSELARAGDHLGEASKEIGTALADTFDDMGDAMSARLGKARKKLLTQRVEATRQIAKLVKLAQEQHAKMHAKARQAISAARKSVADAEKGLEATERRTAKQLERLKIDIERKAETMRKAIDKEAAKLKKTATAKAAAKKPAAKNVASKKTAEKKTASKRPAAKKPAAKKPAARKAAAKKATAKKPAAKKTGAAKSGK